MNVVYQPNKSGPYWFGETVVFNYEYKIGDSFVTLPLLCQESFQITGNSGGTAVKVAGAQDINVKWGAQKSTTAKVNINLKQCSVTSNNGDKPSGSYSIMSITEETPSAITTATSHIPVCQTGPVQFSIDGMAIPNGVNRAATGYEWTIPVGWKFSDGTVSTGAPRLFQTGGSRIQQFTPDCNNGGEVKVRAWTNAEGKGTPHYSKYRTLTVTRNPNVQVTVPSSIKCGVPFEAEVTSLNCATGYNWSVPSGWQISGTGNKRTITPRGTSGTVSVNIPLSTGCTVSTSQAITSVFQPVINGSTNVCSSGTVYQLGDIPSGATATWSVTNASKFINGSGTGTSANLIPSAGATPGSAVLSFTVSGPCGTKTVTKEIWVGNPENNFVWFKSMFYNNVERWGAAFEARTFESVNLRPYINTQLSNILQYEWQVIGPHSTVGLNLTAPQLHLVTTDLPNVPVTVKLRMRNSCGWGNWSTITIYTRGSDAEPEWHIYPNPATTKLTIEKSQALFSKQVSREFETYDVTILNYAGKEVRNYRNITEQSLTVNVEALPRGVYYVHILHDGELQRKQIIIQ